jgi:hypothetical protein
MSIQTYLTRNRFLRFLILIVVCTFFIWTQYEFYQSATFSVDLIQNFSVYAEEMKLPWWIATFYASELGGTIGGIMRWAGSFVALYIAFVYFKNGQIGLSNLKGKVSTVLLLEAIYFLFLIPTIWLGFIFPYIGGNVWYFETTPTMEVFFSAGLTSLLMVLVIPPVLLKLRSKIQHNTPVPEIVRWICITMVAYLFVVFWFNSTMQWAGMIATWGPSLLLDALNFVGFATSAFGLLVVAILALKFTIPIIKKQETAQLNLKHFGITAIGIGSYFLLGIFVYFFAGGFAARPTAWYELIVPHNPYLWCLIFFFTGLLLFAFQKKKQPHPPTSLFS